MKFAIAGSGAMGCRFAYQLKQSGQEVILIDRWPAHIDAIRQNGLHVDWNGQEVVEQFPYLLPRRSDRTSGRGHRLHQGHAVGGHVISHSTGLRT